jgi:hypothetical protein
VTALGTNVAARLASNVWAAADSTTNYAPRTSFVSVSNTVVALGTNVAARLASNVWAAADSTTNYALRTTFVTATNSLQTDINTRLASNTWAAADSTTNYTSRITFNATSNALNSSITSLAARAFVYSTNLSTIAGSGLGVESNRLVVTNIPTTFEALTGDRVAIGGGSITNIATNAIGSIQAIGGIGSGFGPPTIESSAIGSIQRGLITTWDIFGPDATIQIGSVAIGAEQAGIFQARGNNVGGSKIEIGNGSAGAAQRGYFISGQGSLAGRNVVIGTNAFGAMQIGLWFQNGGSASNLAIGAIQLLGGSTEEAYTNTTAATYLTTQSARGSLLLGPGTQTNLYGILANGPIESLNSLRGNFVGNAANLTNFPTSILTVSAGNANYWRITTAPTGSTSSGSSGQIAVEGTNLFIYSPNALGVGTARWLRVSGDVSW